jgi:tetratricopeptide (TPR) repeat protein
MRSTWINQLILLLVCSVALAQTSNDNPLKAVLTLEQQGRFADAIAKVKPLLDSGKLNGDAEGRAWTLLGLAYKQESRLGEAQRAFEQSIRIFEHAPAHEVDYATALHSLSEVYLSLQQFDIATRLEKKALHQYEQIKDHANIARLSVNMAGMEISQKNMDEGKRYLRKADDERKLTTSFDDSDVATLSVIQGWLDFLNSDTSKAIAEYRNALEIWKRKYGDNDPLTAWGHVLVGRARAETNERKAALEEVRSGLSIIEQTVGRQSPKYFAAQMAYSYVLDANGLHAEAKKAKATAEQARKDFYTRQCATCTVSATAFR